MPIMVKPSLKTARLGGVDVPSADVLKKMHDSSYILHARGRLQSGGQQMGCGAKQH